VGTTIPAYCELLVDVTFQPVTPGPYLYTFEYETDNTSISGVQTTLQGIGILPKIRTTNYDLGKTVVNDFEHPNSGMIVITNDSWQYEDSVTITGLVNTNIYKDVAVVPTAWTDFTESFRYDANPTRLPFPVTLQPGETLEIDPVEFVARTKASVSGSLRTISDAETEVTANISGYGTEPGAVEEHNEEIKIYPNPTEYILIINKLPINTSIIQIFDESGKEVRTIDNKNQAESLKISTKDLPVGTYILRLFVGGEVVDKKFVVLR
jgi:hypothetical protein